MKKYISNLSTSFTFMDEALNLAQKAYEAGEVPVGAIIVSTNDKIISSATNCKENSNDPCAHAEIIAIRAASKSIGDWRLTEMRMYVTLEPCLMCLAAIKEARLDGVIFAAYDLKGGAISLNYNFYNDKRLNHNFYVIGGIKSLESANLLSSFFQNKRGLKK
ncbi:MAG: nucleoside deaminase [Oligoflexia bacterium]|nr:nucleoside deaminase [Oligoflexia bacterium]